VHTLKIINTLQRYVLSAVAAAMLLGLGGCSAMTPQETQDKVTTMGGVIGDEVGKYKH
jgi:ribosome biogenesis SPOUT family RNA methylase Rps3